MKNLYIYVVVGILFAPAIFAMEKEKINKRARDVVDPKINTLLYLQGQVAEIRSKHERVSAAHVLAHLTKEQEALPQPTSASKEKAAARSQGNQNIKQAAVPTSTGATQEKTPKKTTPKPLEPSMERCMSSFLVYSFQEEDATPHKKQRVNNQASMEQCITSFPLNANQAINKPGIINVHLAPAMTNIQPAIPTAHLSKGNQLPQAQDLEQFSLAAYIRSVEPAEKQLQPSGTPEEQANSTLSSRVLAFSWAKK